MKKRKIEIDELRSIQLEILKDVHRFCVDNGIKYSLSGGTLLGAVRHKGFIPWDDDIDIMMPRKDYELFARTYHSPVNEVLDLRKSPGCVEVVLKVSRKGTYMTSVQMGTTSWGVNIDVFPLDGVPEDWEKHCEKVLAMNRGLGYICPFYKDAAGRGRFFLLAKYMVKRIAFHRPGSILVKKRELDSFAASCPLESSRLGGAVLGLNWKREIMPSRVFLEYVRLDFEGSQFLAIKDYDTYLSSLYGDYMMPPPEKERVPRHHYDSFVEEA